MHKGYQVLVLLLFLGFCSVLASSWPKDSGQWASWVQAIGSIGAIIGAVQVGRSQAERQRRLTWEMEEEAKRTRSKEKQESLQGACIFLLMVVEAVRQGCDTVLRTYGDSTGRRVRFSAGPVSALREAVLRIPVHNSPHCLLANEVVVLSTAAEKFIRYVTEISELNPDDPKIEPRLVKIREVQSRVDSLQEKLERLRTSYDGSQSMSDPILLRN